MCVWGGVLGGYGLSYCFILKSVVILYVCGYHFLSRGLTLMYYLLKSFFFHAAFISQCVVLEGVKDKLMTASLVLPAL